ncbi:uncharacterized protein LOC117168124 [Belonocnema kinseyi]|uniref:uncharacterized protein LOC117168124 n=1 Tax=Belonocnema kinseyi TaxID=2817044 RepID=UPI00143CC87B|nr:uncharacterized protein LOC117168124 [Belonocnema kinseyi]
MPPWVHPAHQLLSGLFRFGQFLKMVSSVSGVVSLVVRRTALNFNQGVSSPVTQCVFNLFDLFLYGAIYPTAVPNSNAQILPSFLIDNSLLSDWTSERDSCCH